MAGLSSRGLSINGVPQPNAKPDRGRKVTWSPLPRPLASAIHPPFGVTAGLIKRKIGQLGRESAGPNLDWQG